MEEHLRMFAKLKGVDNDIVEEEVKKTLIDVRLTHKKDNFPTELSGGQKRSLSLGIAFIGGSKIVFLGMVHVLFCFFALFWPEYQNIVWLLLFLFCFAWQIQ